ncbi:MAG: class I SAM-dependent methyltransferase [Acidimicrobiales bacterium]
MAPRLSATYDVIGMGYARFRRADRRIASRIHRALGGASTVVNVGAGAGSHEPADRLVVAVEPSAEMIGQRSRTAASALHATAEALPFADRTFEAAMALLTVHHWSDPMAGLAEMRRVTAGPIVVFTFEHEVHSEQWIVTDFLPSMAELDTGMPSPAMIADALGGGFVQVLPVPHDCTDGFCHAWWRRPEAYLAPAVRASISGIARLPTRVVEDAMARLADDLATGAWHQAHSAPFEVGEIDAGYRLVVATPTGAGV